MKFKELPKEVQQFVLSCTMLMDNVELSLDEGLVQDDYNIQKRLDVCQEWYDKMKRALD